MEARLALLVLVLQVWSRARAEAPERPLCAPEAAAVCQEGELSVDEYFYKLNGQHHVINFAVGNYYKARCSAAALDDPAQPRFPRLMRFPRVKLSACAPPRQGSYAAALRALNVSVGERLSLLELPAGARLSAAALADLPPALDSLELIADSAAEALVPEPGFLVPLARLRSLRLQGVRPDRLPPNLDVLCLRDTGIEELPPEALNVELLEVSEPAVRRLAGAAPRLRALTLTAPVLRLPAAPRLERAALALWAERAPAPLRECGALQELRVLRPAAERLPAGFVAACGALRALDLQMLHNVRALPAGLLRNATSLTSFKLAESNIPELPPDLFSYSPNLERIDLTNNHIESLPIALFAEVVSPLRALSLAGNNLTARELRAVAPLTALTDLNLQKNPLGDLCPADNEHLVYRSVSVLAPLRQLRSLQLARARLTRVCADWLRDMQRLARLDLTHNQVRALACEDLRLNRNQLSDIDLSDNPLDLVVCTQEDYENAATIAIPAQRVSLVLDSPLRCDCDAYWLARALRDRRVAAAFAPRCPDGALLADTPLSALRCLQPPQSCAANCSCWLAPAAGGVVAECAALAPRALAALTALGTRADEAPLVELHAAGGGLRALPERWPRTLQYLDLSDNEIANASEAAAAALFSGARRVLLARNPLRCACDAPLLEAARAHRHLLADYDNVTCAGGRRLRDARAALRCGPAPALGAVALAAALAAALLAALMARARWRWRLKALLRGRWGRRVEVADADRPYDVFVAHADADARWVWGALAARLEPARRLCLAQRDWAGGAWIPHQLDASVRRSRLTLCVVSRALLAEGAGGAGAEGAGWVRVALRVAAAVAQAEGGALALVLVGVGAAQLDAELRAALARHPHVCWGEPRFWQKLERALPAPRPRPHTPPAPAPPAPARAAA